MVSSSRPSERHHGFCVIRGRFPRPGRRKYLRAIRNWAAEITVSGPGGLWIISPEGKHLGTIIDPEHPHNMAWGDDDGKTLYLCAQIGLYRIRLKVPGIPPPFAQKELAKR